MNTRTVEEYLLLPYTIEVIPDSDGEYSGYFARVVELPGCMTQADTFAELGDMIQDAIRAWIEVALEDGLPIPLPRPVEEYSGKFVVRLPKSLHRQLAQEAEQEGISLNALVSTTLARHVGAASKPSPTVPIQERTPASALPPLWPQLSKSAWTAMIAAGLEVEAQQVSEQMFSDWLNGQLQQVKAALEGHYLRDAHSHAVQLANALRICRTRSPLMAIFHQISVMLEEQISYNAQVQSSLLDQVNTASLIRREVERSTQRYLAVERRTSESFREPSYSYKPQGDNELDDWLVTQSTQED